MANKTEPSLFALGSVFHSRETCFLNGCSLARGDTLHLSLFWEVICHCQSGTIGANCSEETSPSWDTVEWILPTWHRVRLLGPLVRIYESWLLLQLYNELYARNQARCAAW